MNLLFRTISVCLLSVFLYGQTGYNHPELEWETFETDHFLIHYYSETEASAREGAHVAEQVYPHVAELYDYETPEKTHIIFTDVDDIANGAAYYYDNKIVIWTSPLDFELRGSHRWLQNVITHEFTHILSMQKAMKAGLRFPGAYMQLIGYEEERREDVLYGYPNTLISYPLPGTVVPPWLAEGTAQVMHDGADWDNWDTHRDMILRDRVLNRKMLSFTEMNTFGKGGIGNESVYNAGFALCQYIAVKFGQDKLRKIMDELSRPAQFSIRSAINIATSVPGDTVYIQFRKTLHQRYALLTESVNQSEHKGQILNPDGSANLFPKWAPDNHRFAYLSNKEKDYFSQTDLYVYDQETEAEERIAEGVISAPAWHPDGRVVYYAKRAKYPNSQGSKYFDIWEYDFESEKEARLTEDSRAYSLVFIPKDSALAFLATEGGRQNISMLDLKTNTIHQITDFSNHRILGSLAHDPQNNWLLFDETQNHFRNIRYLSLEDSTIGKLFYNPSWDERNSSVSESGAVVYADDRSGIFNLYYLDQQSGRQGYITNVPGGAFMPAINAEGEVLYSLYEDGAYKIALLDSISIIDELLVGYSPTYFMRNENLAPPMMEQVSKVSVPYEDQFPTMFLLPRIALDYETVKPGFYFYSSEILNRLNVFGGAGFNSTSDADLFFLFELKRFFPTLFAEAFYITRNRIESGKLDEVRDVDDNLKFRLIQFTWGARVPIRGVSELSAQMTWERYRAFVKRSLPRENLEAGVAYDYYRGLSAGLGWKVNTVPNRVDKDINPSGGIAAEIKYRYEQNDFIEGLNLSEAGTLQEEFGPNNTHRLEAESDFHWSIPNTPRWTISFGAQAGWISNTEADSFFHFFGGGMPGLKGYPFYSIEGNRIAIGEASLRIPVFRQKHWEMGPFILQNGVFGVILQAGDAWRTIKSDISLKRSIGIQWRFNGYSFYNFPTAIGLEIHRGLDEFLWTGQGNTVTYGKKNRTYLTILFGF